MIKKAVAFMVKLMKNNVNDNNNNDKIKNK